ncbi:hypothetical protein IT414_04220 [bacterium]|nr:hypothetical protein [bacterium]
MTEAQEPRPDSEDGRKSADVYASLLSGDTPEEERAAENREAVFKIGQDAVESRDGHSFKVEILGDPVENDGVKWVRVALKPDSHEGAETYDLPYFAKLSDLKHQMPDNPDHPVYGGRTSNSIHEKEHQEFIAKLVEAGRMDEAISMQEAARDMQPTLDRMHVEGFGEAHGRRDAAKEAVARAAQRLRDAGEAAAAEELVTQNAEANAEADSSEWASVHENAKDTLAHAAAERHRTQESIAELANGALGTLSETGKSGRFALDVRDLADRSVVDKARRTVSLALERAAAPSIVEEVRSKAGDKMVDFYYACDADSSGRLLYVERRDQLTGRLVEIKTLVSKGAAIESGGRLSGGRLALSAEARRLSWGISEQDSNNPEAWGLVDYDQKLDRDGVYRITGQKLTTDELLYGSLLEAGLSEEEARGKMDDITVSRMGIRSRLDRRRLPSTDEDRSAEPDEGSDAVDPVRRRILGLGRRKGPGDAVASDSESASVEDSTDDSSESVSGTGEPSLDTSEEENPSSRPARWQRIRGLRDRARRFLDADDEPRGETATSASTDAELIGTPAAEAVVGRADVWDLGEDTDGNPMRKAITVYGEPDSDGRIRALVDGVEQMIPVNQTEGYRLRVEPTSPDESAAATSVVESSLPPAGPPLPPTASTERPSAPAASLEEGADSGDVIPPGTFDDREFTPPPPMTPVGPTSAEQPAAPTDTEATSSTTEPAPETPSEPEAEPVTGEFTAYGEPVKAIRSEDPSQKVSIEGYYGGDPADPRFVKIAGSDEPESRNSLLEYKPFQYGTQSATYIAPTGGGPVEVYGSYGADAKYFETDRGVVEKDLLDFGPEDAVAAAE